MKGEDAFPGSTLVCTHETSAHTRGALADCPSAAHTDCSPKPLSAQSEAPRSRVEK